MASEETEVAPDAIVSASPGEDTVAAPEVADTVLATAARRPRTDHRELQKGDAIGRYVVLHKLGAGGMGEVFAAYDPELDRKVALKLLRLDRLRGEQEQERLLAEAQALAKLNHPNVVSVHDVGKHEGQVYLAMEFVEGETLKAWADSRERDWK